MIQTEFENSETARTYFLLNRLRKKNLLDEFEKEIKNNGKFEKNISGTGAEHYVKKYIIDKAFIEYFITKSDFRSAFESHSSQSDNLIIAALFSCFNFVEQKDVAKNGYNIKIDPSLANFFLENINLENFITEINISSDKYFPHINVSYLGYLMITYPENEKYFYEMKEMVYNNRKNLAGRRNSFYSENGILLC
ncbi:MAG: hypothetical protein IPM38_10070 [Ignavibacteria bacterium]|nr:hypothetical protein [Ignavibacteria bacterium]